MLNSAFPVAAMGFKNMLNNLGSDIEQIGGWALQVLGVAALVYGFFQIGRGVFASQNKGHYFMGGALAIIIGAALATGGHRMIDLVKSSNDSANNLLHGKVNAILAQPLMAIKSLPSMSWFNF